MQAADIRFTLYPVGFIISAVFLAATLAAGWLLPASHHVLHWRCQTHHVTCLMLGDLLMAIIQLAGDSLHGGSCKALGESRCLFLRFIVLFYISVWSVNRAPLPWNRCLHQRDYIEANYIHKSWFELGDAHKYVHLPLLNNNREIQCKGWMKFINKK